MDVRFAVPHTMMEITEMTISGKLLTPTGEPMSDTVIRLTSTENSPSILKGVSKEFTTDSSGDYNVNVPVGRYHVEQYDKLGRNYRSVGVLDISNDTQVLDLPTLLMIGQTVVPRDPLLQMIEDEVASVDSKVSTAIAEALDDIGVGATFISADENNRLKRGQDGGYYVSDDFIPDPLAHYILAKG